MERCEVRLLWLLTLIIPLNSYGFWGDSCAFEGEANHQKILLTFLGQEDGYGLQGSQIYGHCTPGKMHDYDQNFSLSCAAKKGGKQVVYYETKVIRYPKSAEEGMSAVTFVCMSGCEGNVVKKFIQKCDPD